MKLTPSERERFNEFFNELFDVLDFDPDELTLKGSFATKLLALYAGDVDLYEYIPKKQFNKWFKTTYQDLQKELKSRMIELKTGETKYKGFVNKENLLKGLDDAPPDKQKIKLDFYYIIQGYPLEMSIIYDFGKPQSDISVMDDLISDMILYYDEENYFKIFKRLEAFFELRGIVNKDVRKVLLNPIFANIYLIISRLETMKRIFTKEEKKPYLELIKEDLREIGLTKLYRDNVEAMINILKAYLNKAIYKYIGQFKKVFS